MKIYLVMTESVEEYRDVDSVWTTTEAAEARMAEVESLARQHKVNVCQVDVVETDLDAVCEMREVAGRYC